MSISLWSFPINYSDSDDEENDVIVVEKVLIASTIADSVTSFKKSNSSCGGSWHYYLPVKEIDGVDVQVQFVGNENGLSLYIKSKIYIYGRKRLISVYSATIRQHILFKKTYIKKETGDEYTLRDFINVLELIDADILIMKFNRVDGVLFTPDVLHPKDQGTVFTHFDETNPQQMITFESEGVESEDCCVCLESTKTTTPCGHKLCVMCWGKVKKINRCIPCPICRKNLTNREEIDYLYPNGMATGPDAEIEEEDIDYWDDETDDETDNDDDFGFGYDDPHSNISEFPSVRQNSIMDMN